MKCEYGLVINLLYRVSLLLRKLAIYCALIILTGLCMGEAWHDLSIYGLCGQVCSCWSLLTLFLLFGINFA